MFINILIKLILIVFLIQKSSFASDQKILDQATELYNEEKYLKSIELLKQIPDNVSAQYKLGYNYWFGLKDIDNSLDWFVKCAEKGNVDCQYYAYGLEYYHNENEERSHYWLELCANNGDATCQTDLSYRYDEGIFVKQDLEKGHKWLELCASGGDATCQNNLGHRYDNGIFVSKNTKKAFDLFLKSADQGLSNAYTTIAAYYIDGEVVNQSYSKAFEYYKLGSEAEYGNTERAIYGLALMYEKGLGTKVDYKKAKELYLKAHDLGHELSLNRISAIEGDVIYALDFAEKYKTGSDIDIGLPIDYEDSAFFYKIAEFKGYGDPVGFEDLFNIMTTRGYDREWDRAAERFEIWKSNLGFSDPDTLNDITEYFFNHYGTASYINPNFLITNKHVTHSDEYPYLKKCEKLIGFDPYTGVYEEYEIYDSDYLPNTLDIDLIYNPNSTEYSSSPINKNNPRLGETIVTIGFPKATELSKYPKITSGLVTSDYGFLNNPDEFLIDATSYGGSSGSPIYNTFGELTGILWGGPQTVLGNSPDAETINDPNIAFVVKSTYLKRFLDLNQITYSLGDQDTKLEIADVVENNIKRLRLIECYIK